MLLLDGVLDRAVAAGEDLVRALSGPHRALGGPAQDLSLRLAALLWDLGVVLCVIHNSSCAYIAISGSAEEAVITDYEFRSAVADIGFIDVLGERKSFSPVLKATEVFLV